MILERRRKMDKLLTVTELSEYLRLNKVSIWKYAKEGKLPAFKIGRCWKFSKRIIDEVLQCSDPAVMY
jgi:excisionase family DNA binding protein